MRSLWNYITIAIQTRHISNTLFSSLVNKTRLRPYSEFIERYRQAQFVVITLFAAYIKLFCDQPPVNKVLR